MVDLLYYITMRKAQLRIEAERGLEMGYPERRWGLIEGERNALDDIERMLKDDENRKVER